MCAVCTSHTVNNDLALIYVAHPKPIRSLPKDAAEGNGIPSMSDSFCSRREEGDDGSGCCVSATAD